MATTTCPSCSAPVPYGQPRCGRCGTLVGGSAAGDAPRTMAMAQVPAGVHDTGPSQPVVPLAGPPRPEEPARAGNMMTQVAGTAMNMSSVFTASFKRAVPGWAGELKEPVGPSTGGGAQSQQPLTLVAQNGQRLAIGRVDAARRTVHLRTHAVVSRLCEQRFGRPFAVTPEDYQRFTELAGQLFRTYGFQVTHETVLVAAETSRPRSVAPPSNNAQINTWLLIVLVALVAALLVIVLITMLR